MLRQQLEESKRREEKLLEALEMAKNRPGNDRDQEILGIIGQQTDIVTDVQDRLQKVEHATKDIKVKQN